MNPTKNQKPKPKLTDAERHKRFIETAKKVEASEIPEDFERAFAKVMNIKIIAKTGNPSTRS